MLLRRLSLACFVALVGHVSAHGALTTPITRRGNTGYENDPVRGNTADSFVCRHVDRNPLVPLHAVTAGQSTDITWSFSAAHVGDCAVFLSYDTTSPLAQQKYFKIANLPKCRDQNRQAFTIALPDWLPGGQAILRWDWYALHQFPSVEFYSQCIDVTIQPTGSAVSIASISGYSITVPPIYPANGRAGEYRDPFNGGGQLGSPGFFMTGPACARGFALNECGLTENNGGGGTPIPDNGGELTPPDDVDPPTCSEVSRTVQAGDTLGSIVLLYPDQGVDWKQICDRNNLASCNQLTVGEVLAIPCDPSFSPIGNSGQGNDKGDGGDDGGGGVGSVGAGFIGAIVGFFAGMLFWAVGLPWLRSKCGDAPSAQPKKGDDRRFSGGWQAHTQNYNPAGQELSAGQEHSAQTGIPPPPPPQGQDGGPHALKIGQV